MKSLTTFDQTASTCSTPIDKKKLDCAGFYLLPKFLSEEEAKTYETTTRNLPVCWVYTSGLKEIKYKAQYLHCDDNLGRFFLSKSILTLISSACGFTSVKEPNDFLFWIHRYELGQYITEHKDKAGDIQLLLSLKQPAQENGGALFIKKEGLITPIPMQVGDAALMYASQYTHFSNVLIETQEDKTPSKVIAVARYYF